MVRLSMVVAWAVVVSAAMGATRVHAAHPISTTATDQHARSDAPRRMVIAGGIVGGVGLLASAIGFSTLAGMHAADPGRGLEFDRGSRRTVTIARSMEGLGATGVALIATGGIVSAIGAIGWRRQARDEPRLRLAPGLGSLTLFGRF
jgi:hypothetical protein